MIMRQSNFECLRIVCIIFIILMHISGAALSTTNTYNILLIQIINTIGNTGVTLFILITGYFGIRFKLRKLITLLIITWFYSFYSYLFQIIFENRNIQTPELVTTVFPILRNKYWFITNYVILYCLSPLLNRIISSLPQRNSQQLLLVICFFFIISPTFFYVDILKDGGKGIVNMVLIYLTGQYLKTYTLPYFLQRYNKLLLAGCLICIFSLNTLLTLLNGNFVLKFAHDNSLFIFIASICIFHWVGQWKYSSNVINSLARYTFPLYLVQALLTNSTKSWYLPYINDYDFIIHLIYTTCFICFATLIIENIRQKTFHHLDENITSFIIKGLLSFKNFKRNTSYL